MSRYSGPQRRGAAKQTRELKRQKALERDKQLDTLSARRRQYRLAVLALEKKRGTNG